jgi:hypothetical protein
MTARVLEFKADSASSPGEESQGVPKLGTIVAFDDDAAPMVAFGGTHVALRARLAFAASRLALQEACATGAQVMLLFEEGQRDKPIIIGFVRTGPSTDPTSAHTDPSTMCIEADVDGRRVRVTARDELVFQCGAASVTLTRSGRVIVRGTYVETQASGTNRIKGGQVRIN